MTPAPVPRALHRLAHSWGVQTAFYDCHGTRHHASAETLLAVLAALGAPVAGPLAGVRDVDDALAARAAWRWSRVAEPVLVAWDGRPPPLDLRLPASVAEGRLTGELRLESGETRGLSWNLTAAPRVQAADVDGTARVVLRLDMSTGPGAGTGAAAPLPLGRHALQLSLGGSPGAAVGGRALAAPGPGGAVTILSAPLRVGAESRDAPREWGVFLPLFALRSAASLGIGDLSDLGRLADWVAGRGGRALATLPLLAAFLDGEHGDGGLFEPSPYMPASRLAWNPAYADLAAEPEWRAPAVAARAGNEAFAAEREALASAPYHDYRRLAALRRPLLDAMASAAFASPRRAELETWAAAHPRRADYARFRGACAALGGRFHTWPAAAAAGTLAPGDSDPAVERRHLYAQFIAARQVDALAVRCRALGLRLLIDQPLGVHPNGYDVWRRRGLFAPGVSCGAPPDDFFVRGQDWGFPPPLPEASRAEGHEYVTATLRHLLLPGQMLRIDHVLGLQRLYWVPRGAPPTAGAYVRGHPEESFAVLCLEAARAGARVVGEDLGTVPRGLRARMARHGLLRTHVMQFAAHARVPAASMASLNTQDMPPFAGFLDGDDIDGFAELGLIDPALRRRLREDRARLVAELRTWLEEEHELRPDVDGHALMRACNARLAGSRAALVVVNLEDLWDEARPHNVPGTSHERPNWRRLAARRLEQLEDDTEVAACLAEVDARRRRPRRSAPPTDGAAYTRLGALDTETFTAGRHAHAHDLVGARREVAEDIAGARFACWAPGATAVSVFGGFDGWDPGHHPLAPADGGLWETFVPGAPRGTLYKFHVTDAAGSHAHADPFAGRSEQGGQGASMLWTRDFDWDDDAWLVASAERGAPEGGRWLALDAAPAGGWAALRNGLVERARREGAAGVRLSAAAWGPRPGVPGPEGGVPQELMALVDGLHRAGLALACEWRPDPRAFDLTREAAADADPWARPERRSLLLGAALLRVAVFHADVLELPADAGVPGELAARLAALLAERHPGTRLVTPGA